MPTLNNRLHGRRNPHDLHEPEVTKPKVTKAPADKPARITRAQLVRVQALIQRVAAGGDATCAVDAGQLLPMLAAAVAVAPLANGKPRIRYRITQPSGGQLEALGLDSAAAMVGKARSTLANAMTRGGGVALFSTTDDNGNPATLQVEKLA